MSAGREQQPKRELGARRAPGKLGPLPRPLAMALLVAWLGLTLVALISVLGGPAPWSGERELLVPQAQRSAARSMALVRVDFDALAELGEAAKAGEATGELLGPDTDPRTILAEASFAIEEGLGQAREPLAPPKTEITRWLDAHALYLLPIETHAALGERLTNDNIRAEVSGLRARLSSPLFSVSGDQPRRDPLGLRELTARESGRLGHVAQVPGSLAPRVSASGDLVSASGDRALIALRADQSLEALESALDEALAGLPVEFALVDARAERSRLAAQLGEHWPKLALACLASLVLLLSIVLRRVGPVLVFAACLSSAWVVLVWLATQLGLSLVSIGGVELGGLGGIELLSLALTLMALGVGCEGALELPKIGGRSWVAPSVLALTLVPLCLAPYPLWQRWALWWAVAQLLLSATMRGVAPVLLALAGIDLAGERRGFRLVSIPAVAAACCFALALAGAWGHPQRDYRSLAHLPTSDATSAALQRELSAHFFDPSMIVEARSLPGESESEGQSPAAAALDAAAHTSAALAQLVPSAARRIDSPGSFIIPHKELESRKQALQQLELDARMEVLSGQLEDQGLRAEAFAEFIRGAADIDELPSAQAALDGPLGPWIRAYLVDEDGRGPALRTLVELRGRSGLMTQPLTPDELDELPRLRGPAMAALEDQREANSRLILVTVVGLWLSALVIWLGSGRFSTALAAAIVAASCELGLGFALHLLDQARGPHMLPVLLITGVSAALAGARACELVAREQALFARDFLLAAGCQIAVGLALLGTSELLWRELGVGFAIGGALACGLGLFITPGIARLFGRLDKHSPTPDTPAGDDSKQDGEP